MAPRVPEAPPSLCHAVYRARSCDLLQVGKDAARLMRATDGSRTVAAILADFSEAQRPKVERFLRDLFTRGLLTASGSARAARRVAAPASAAKRHASAEDLAISAAADQRARAAETIHLYCKPSPG